MAAVQTISPNFRLCLAGALICLATACQSTPEIVLEEDTWEPPSALDGGAEHSDAPVENFHELTCTTDADGDGFIAAECGGADCNDADGYVSPDAHEMCDMVDNNCSGKNNEGLECGFYAHTFKNVYRVDPFSQSFRFVAEGPPNIQLFDFDTHPDGTLYGVTSAYLYRFDESTGLWTKNPHTFSATGVNGFAISQNGVGYLTGSNKVYSVDLVTAEATLLGELGAGFRSSGDCVINRKTGSFFESAAGDSHGDRLVAIDGNTYLGTEIGPIGFGAVYGLTEAFGRLLGVTYAGEVIEIDPLTGAGTLIFQTGDIRFAGAASTATLGI